MRWTLPQVPAGTEAGRRVTDWDSQLGQDSSLASPILVQWPALPSPPQEVLWHTGFK